MFCMTEPTLHGAVEFFKWYLLLPEIIPPLRVRGGWVGLFFPARIEIGDVSLISR